MGLGPIKFRICWAKVAVYALFFLCSQSYGWSSLGHRIIGQIAYDNLSKETRKRANFYNHALDKFFKPQSLVNSAAWLDCINDRKLKKKHFYDIPFSFDGTKLSPPEQVNAITAIEEAVADLKSNSININKGLSLRILLHVIGDLHQPLHAATQFSAAHPQSDFGGNLYLLGKNPVAMNLHQYWDKGGGLLAAKKYSNKQVRRRALEIERLWPCKLEAMNLDPKVWANESHQLAVKKAYLIKEGQKPSPQYKHMVKQITEQQLALAGCRLAATLNKLL